MKRRHFGLGLWFFAAICGSSCAAESRPPASNTDLTQTVVLEATRQDLVAHRLDELITGIGYIKQDLSSNGQLEAETGKRLELIARRLVALRDGPLAKAQGLLREATANPARLSKLLGDAQHEIVPIRRELGSLLLQVGVTQATEVFAAELHELWTRQETLAHSAGEAADEAAASGQAAAVQKDLATALRRLLSEIDKLPGNDNSEALTTVRLARARKTLEESGVEQLMDAATHSLESGDAAAARPGQLKALEIMRNTEIQLRPEARLQALVQARNDLENLKQKEVDLGRGAEGLGAEEFGKAATSLGRRELALCQPLETMSASLGIEQYTRAAQTASGDAAQHFTNRDKSAALAAISATEQALGKAIEILDKHITDAQKLDVRYRALQAAMSRVKLLEDLHERQAQIIDDTDALATAKKDVARLAEPEHALAGQVAQFSAALPKDSQWDSVLKNALNGAADRIGRTEAELRKSRTVAAREAEAEALQALNTASETAGKEVAFLEQLWTLTQLASDLSAVSRCAGDVEAEQRDLRKQVEANLAASKSALDLAAAQGLLARAAGEAEETAAQIAEARAIEPLLTDAKQRMASAATGLGQDKAAAATPLQKDAEDKLAQTNTMAIEMATRAEYMAGWVAAMEQNAVVGVDLLQRQILLRTKTEAARGETVAEFEPDQTMLKGETEVWGTMDVVGASYQKAADEMGLASAALKAVKQTEAVQHQKRSEELLKKALDEMFKWLASVQVMQQPPSDRPVAKRVMNVLNRLFTLVMGEEELRNRTKLAANQNEFESLGSDQDGLGKQLDDALAVLERREYVSEPAKAFMEEAKTKMNESMDVLSKAKRDAAVEAEMRVEAALRKAIAQLMVEAFTPPDKMDDDNKTPDDMNKDEETETPPPPPDPKEAMMGFIKGAVKGESVAKSRQQWDPLGQRDRGALNENFARELPLEYRDNLKEYYLELARSGGDSEYETSGGHATRAQENPPGNALAATPQADATLQSAQGQAEELITPKTEAAVARGLEFLKQTQHPDGSWERQYSVAITSVSVIAFMMQGNFPKERPYGETLEKGLNFLLNESKNGASGYMGASMYEHGLATLALSELWGQTDRDDEIREALKRAVDVILKSQSSMGGWRYDPDRTDADVSVTVMQLVALSSARQAGILVPDQTIDKAIKYVQSCNDPGTGGFRYMPFPGQPGFARSAAAVVCLMMCGRRQDPEVTKGLQYLVNQSEASFKETEFYPYAHYYSAVASYLSGDEPFKKWYPRIRDVILASQDKNGAFGGKFNGGLGQAMALIILGLPNGFVPVYQR